MTCDTRASVAEPRVSVICIFLDEERFLAEAVESVVAQAYDDYELLLVDDGSTDGSTRIARDYAERFPGRVTYLEHEGHANRGMSATRNLGLAVARGEHIAFIDADDRWRSGKLAEQAAVLDTNTEAGSCFSRTKPKRGHRSAAQAPVHHRSNREWPAANRPLSVCLGDDGRAVYLHTQGSAEVQLPLYEESVRLTLEWMREELAGSHRAPGSAAVTPA